MTERSIRCTFHHVSSDLSKTIPSLLGISKLSKEKDNQFSYSCSLCKAREIRSNLADLFGQYPQIWFSIDSSNPSTTKTNKTTYPIDHIYFGSLLSTEKFLIHDTPLNSNKNWKIKIFNKQTLFIESEEGGQTSIRLSIPFKSFHKQILVIDGEDFAEMIFSYEMLTIDKKPEKLYGNDPIVKSLNQSTDLLICLSPKSTVDLFLDNFNSFRIFYTTIAIQHCTSPWSTDVFNDYRTDHTRYTISMLHSLGNVFDDKYFSSADLRKTMIELARQDERSFYQLALKASSELRKCHWLDLKGLFAKKASVPTTNEDKILYVPVIHLTPTRLRIMPKEKSKGHRALRHQSFQGSNDFCLVYLKPDPPDIYFNDNNNQIVDCFRAIFLEGIELNGYRYHLFGSSNSQIKEHSFWFIKAASLDEIHSKRRCLGELEKINNLGTYVARLGLWFSKTDSTEIRLIYCFNENEFHSRLNRGEKCVLMIDDVERNNYCFTDGNGLVSKGLAKLINERILSHSSIIPSAYQIRIAGCKGLIILDSQSTDNQVYLKIRPSMKKFECDDWTLDICGYSRATASRLNNQFIWLLSDLGVSDNTLLRLQQRWFKKKPSSFNCSELSDLSANNDLLKNKIPLPVNECRYIYGCALESQLQEGQCFIRYQILNENGKPSTNAKFDCVRGRVIVTKNPCPYAGDMLELWAVDLPELYHLRDVVVFSTRGERPDFNKIAGSDLDGDGYFVYWGEELRLQYQVKPLDYTPDEKQYQTAPISPEDVINYCLSTISATSSGEIYNLHAIIVDQNYENCQQRTCQALAIELARMFSSAVDSGKTGYVIDKKRIRQIREKHGKKYPDFLGKDMKRSYRSESIVGKLYRNALYYVNGKVDQLEDVFAQLNLDDDNEKKLSIPHPASPKIIADQPLDLSTTIDSHPGSPLSIHSNSISINDEGSVEKIPPQFLLLDGMNSTSSLIRLSVSSKPFYSEHTDLTRLRIELDRSSADYHHISSPSSSSLFFEHFSSLEYLLNNNQSSTMIISFGYIYLLKYNEQNLRDNQFPKTVASLLNKHFLPPLFDTFFPSTILERIEITKENNHHLQQIFYQASHQIKPEYLESNSDSIILLFPWFQMNFIDHRREILLICFNIQSHEEIRVHFDKNGRIKSIDSLPKIFFKCFHQQNTDARPDILYEFRSHSTINTSSIFKHETLLDPTNPLTLPLQDNIIPIVSYSIITNIFQYNDIQMHLIRTYSPLHYKNEEFYKLRCVLGYLEQQHSVEIQVQMNKNEKVNREKLRYIMALAIELSQMLE